ncbi:alpha-amylase family glycosyl hydrolase [Paludisphaera mucosa]|uniref:Alpha-amylase family glycosyl hydrolase n=1 Tax=Paludisphaera mucosa TaxID=3030827 RepID=A0ABT6FE24_9BACT|nr:alpha-amylase family glycosyl hydrolase [Paludisphaera mucosa]MDG3005828.1 alpha-amylase family glycosyl hydrolase [Paludisphaera mucosa]
MPTAPARLVALAVILTTAAAAGAQTVDRVGPPSWWVDDEPQRLTLLVEGSGLLDAAVRVAEGPIRIERIEAIAGGRAVFVDVAIPAGAAPGRCTIAIGPNVRIPWDLVPRPPRRPQPFGPDDVVYLVMPDRFADGDPTNNEAPDGDRMFDRKDAHAYHGGDFAGLRKRLPALADLGVTALWLTPLYRPADNWTEANVAGKPRKLADFHGYAPVDFYAINPRFGTFDEYRALVAEAHALGLKVIQDQLLGFTGPEHPWRDRPPTDDWLHGPIGHPPEVSFRLGALADPHALESERRGVTDGWYYGLLPDLNMRDDRVIRYAFQQSLWWTTLFEADGVRLDTFPMVDRTFWRTWHGRLQATHPAMRAVGEAMTWDASELSFFQGGRAGWDGVDPGVESVFDFPMQGAATGVFRGKDPVSFLAQRLGSDHLYSNPDLLMTLLDNHDLPRLASVPGVTPARLRLAAAFLLTSRGIPQITWGDEIGLPGDGDDRRDYPGGFPGDPRDALTAAGRTPEEERLFSTYRALLHLRKDEPSLRRGRQTTLMATDEAYAFLREFEGSRVVVALNRGGKPARLKMPAFLTGPAVVLMGEGRWTPGPDGAVLDVPPESAVILGYAR